MLGNQNARLMEQRNKLLDMVERLQPTEPEPSIEPAKIEMLQTPVGYVKVGDVIAYDSCNKRICFGTITRLSKDGFIDLTHRYSVVFGADNKQVIYQSMGGTIESYRVFRVL